MGLFDPGSAIPFRVLQVGKPQTIDEGWWAARLDQALEKRRLLFDDQTTGYRCLNGESDGFPGLVLDRYGGTLVLKLYTVAWLPRLDFLARLILARCNADRLVLRLSRNIQGPAQKKFAKVDGEILRGAGPDGPVAFVETGLRFEADVLRGQKTGFFLDQRENRRLVESFSAGRRVLNAFSFSGGFSLYAARGRARSVTDLDLSAHALAGAKRNFLLNQDSSQVIECLHESIQADAFEWFRDKQNPTFDLIVLDPPSLAKREVERAGAIRAYERLGFLALKSLSPGGLLVACSCSAHVSAEEFFGAIERSSRRSCRRYEEIKRTGHAPDHPAAFKEAEYLKGIYLKFSRSPNRKLDLRQSR